MGRIELDSLVKYAYTRLPPIVVSKDIEIDEVRPPLFNFIRAMFEGYTEYKDNPNDPENPIATYNMGAGELVLQKINDFVNLIDPEKCPDEWFPYLYESFGLTYNPLIEEMRSIYNPKSSLYVGPYDGKVYYHRKFLSNIGALLKRRGTKAGLRFLVRTLTGFEFHYSYTRGYIDVDSDDGTVKAVNDIESDRSNKKYGRFITINLVVDSAEKALELENSKRVIEQFLTPFLPHYITLFIGDSLTYSTITSKRAMVVTPSYSVDNKTPLRARKQ